MKMIKLTKAVVPLKKYSLLAMVLAVLLTLSGCIGKSPQDKDTSPKSTPPQQAGDTNLQPQTSNQQEKNKPSLGGIHLEDTVQMTEEALGKDYKDTKVDEPGHFPESYIKREYTKGITLILGKDSKKVLEIDAISEDFTTDLGIKVGDQAKKVADAYGAKYSLFESQQGEGKLEGFYLLNDKDLMIFDYDKKDRTILNHDVKPESKVEMIRLTQKGFVD